LYVLQIQPAARNTTTLTTDASAPGTDRGRRFHGDPHAVNGDDLFEAEQLARVFIGMSHIKSGIPS
jgi:hypothetical protein